MVAQGFACGFGTGDAGLGALNQEITLKLCHRIDDVDGHFSGRTGEIDPTGGEAMNTNANFFEFGYGGADIDGVPAKSVEPGDNQHISLLHFTQ